MHGLCSRKQAHVVSIYIKNAALLAIVMENREDDYIHYLGKQ